MSKQKINQIAFDIAYKRSLNKKKSQIKDDFCAYRGANNNCCFVGALIKDEHYNPLLEDKCAGAYAVQEAVKRSLGKLPSRRLLNELQKIHDRFKPEDWDEELEQLAKEYNLTIPT